VSGAQNPSRPRRELAGLVLWAVAVLAFILAAALFLIGLVGVALLLDGLSSWMHAIDVAAAWARTLGGIGLVGASSGLAALGWLLVERLVGPLGRFARLRNSAATAGAGAETPWQRARKFVAAIGLLLALICLPFAAAIHAASHASWLG